MRRALFFSALALALASTSPLNAQTNDPALTEAQARFKEGLDLADAGNQEAARLKFQQAWSVYKSAAVLYNLARSEQLTGHDIEAFQHFREFLKTGPDPKITAEHRKKAEDNVTALAAKLGQIDVTAPPNARVTVDGQVAPEAVREPVPVSPGRHVVEATFEGRIKSITVECGAGATTKARIEFETNGNGGNNRTTEPPPVVEERTSSSRYIVPGVIGGVGLVGIGVGVVFALSSQSAKDDEDALRKPGICTNTTSPECQALDDKRSSVTTKGTIATVGYVAGGVLLAAAVVTYLVWPSSKVTVTGDANRNGGTMGLTGSF